MAGGDGGEGRNECVMRYFGTQRGMWEHDTVFWGATRHATSLQRPWVAWYASMVEGAGDGRGNLREEPRRPRPYSRQLRGYHCGSHREPKGIHCRPPMEIHGLYPDAPHWLGRALALLGTSPTKIAMANLENR